MTKFKNPARGSSNSGGVRVQRRHKGWGDKGLPFFFFLLSLSLSFFFSIPLACFYVASYFASLLLFLAKRTHLRRDSNFFSPVRSRASQTSRNWRGDSGVELGCASIWNARGLPRNFNQFRPPPLPFAVILRFSVLTLEIAIRTEESVRWFGLYRQIRGYSVQAVGYFRSIPTSIAIHRYSSFEYPWCGSCKCFLEPVTR